MAGPWDKYASSSTSQAGPWAKYRTPETPPSPPSQFAQDTDTIEKWAATNPTLPLGLNALPVGAATRFIVSAGQNAANAITQTPGFVYHSIFDAPTLEESTLTPQQRIVGRILGVPQAAEAASDYASGNVTPQRALSVLPEALGAGVGQVAGGAAYARLGTAAKATPAELNRIIPSTTRSGTGFGLLENWYAKHPVTAPRFLAETARMEEEFTGSREQLRKVAPVIAGVQRTIAEAEINKGRGLPGFEFDFKTARDALDRLNAHIDFKHPTPANALYRRAAGALADDIMEATGKTSNVAPKGFQADYQRMVNEARQGYKTIRTGEAIGPYAGALAGYGLGRALGAPLGAEFVMGYGGKALGRSAAGALVRSVIEREAGPPNISAPPAPPTAVMAPPSAPPAPPMATAAPMPPPAPPAMTPTARPLTPAELAIQQAPGGRGVARDIGQWQPPPELGAFSAEDVGAKVKGKEVSRNAKVLTQAEALGGKPPEGTPERRLVDRTGQAAEDRLFAQARRVLGEDATSKQVADKVEELRKAQKRPSAPPPPPVETPHTRLLAEVNSDPLSVHGNEQSTYVPFVKEGKLVGHGWFDARPDIGEGVAEVSRADISQAFRGTGLAKGLYQSLYNEAIRRGFTRLVSDSVQTGEAKQAWDAAVKRGMAKEITDPYGGKRYEYTPPAPPPPPKPIARNLPPEAYTRFLLQAKSGEISPGELERRFAKYGQPYEVRPLKRG